MSFLNIIEKKKLGIELTKLEIDNLVKDYVEGKIPDYQMSAFLMAVDFTSMTTLETVILTKAMINSGLTFDLEKVKGTKLDKHSTGGIGDKISLIISPIVASLGAKVTKLSGRGLGFTGGTIDKLETIPGYKINLSSKDFISQVNQIGLAIISTSPKLVPADKKIYALRDVTSTVDSIPLIASSIMSKKIATGSDAILLDVKCGDGAFMKDYKRAKELAKVIIAIGKNFGKDVRVEITNMSRPLGRSIGNKNEVLEAVDFLNGQGTDDLKELIISSSATMVMQAKLFANFQDAKDAVLGTLKSGKALKKFKEWIKAQGGDIDYVLSKNYWSPKYKKQVVAEKDGFLNITSALKFGQVAASLGAGRMFKGEDIDHEAGIQLLKKTNQTVKKGDILFELFSSKAVKEQVLKDLQLSYEIVEKKVNFKMILGRFE